MTSIGKENKQSMLIFIKNSKGKEEKKKEEKKKRKKKGGGGSLTSSRKDWVEFYECIK